jgi:hypothetical protein
LHTVLPCADAYHPYPHVRHPTDSPVLSMYIPGVHSVHALAPLFVV